MQFANNGFTLIIVLWFRLNHAWVCSSVRFKTSWETFTFPYFGFCSWRQGYIEKGNKDNKTFLMSKAFQCSKQFYILKAVTKMLKILKCWIVTFTFPFLHKMSLHNNSEAINFQRRQPSVCFVICLFSVSYNRWSDIWVVSTREYSVGRGANTITTTGANTQHHRRLYHFIFNRHFHF